MIDSGSFLNFLYCWGRATNTEAGSIPVAFAHYEFSFPWQCPAAVASLRPFGVHITHPNVIEFVFHEPSEIMNRWSSVLSLCRIVSMLVWLMCWVIWLIHFGCLCLNISQGKTGPFWLVSCGLSMVAIRS